MKKLLVVLAVLALLVPGMGLIGIGVLMNPSASASCVTDASDNGGGGVGGPIDVGDVPDSLAVTTADGQHLTLTKKQLTRAAEIITVGSRIDGVTRDGLQISLMAALTESDLRNLANTGTYPESQDYPHDGNGSDHDSVGLWQMRPQSGWGSVKELMDVDYETRAFFGGDEGPNHGSPRGLLDIPGWADMDKGAAAQAVEVSAFPDRYATYEPVAAAILKKLLAGSTSSSSASASPASADATAGSSAVVFPLPEGSWTATSPFGYRTHPITGERKLHAGADYAAPDGTKIMAVAAGTVTRADYSDSRGGHIVIEHEIEGKTVATMYVHMWQKGIHVDEGDTVKAGQHIADVGSSGQSTGPHLHLEVHLGGEDGTLTDPTAWLKKHGATDLDSPGEDAPTGSASTCEDADGGGDGTAPDPDTNVEPPKKNKDGSWPEESCSEPDPSQPTREGACVTPRTVTILKQVDAMGTKDDGIACWDPHEQNATSDHPKGKACDFTFGTIGQFPKGQDKKDGDALADWLSDKKHAETWGVQYVIRQGQIWNIDRPEDGWRRYNGGGVYDPSDPTGGHYDHVHLSMK